MCKCAKVHADLSDCVVVLLTMLTKRCLTNCTLFSSVLKKLVSLQNVGSFQVSTWKLYKFLLLLYVYYALEFSS